MSKFKYLINHLLGEAGVSAMVKLTLAAVFALIIFGTTGIAMASSESSADNSAKVSNAQRLITINDNGTERTILTRATTVGDALKDANITTSADDDIEPKINAKLDGTSVKINIYRARPIVVVDGARTVRVVTMAQSPTAVAAVAGIKLYPEDKTATEPVRNILAAGGAGLQMSITRAKVVNMKLYGQASEMRTHAATVREFLNEKKVALGPDDVVSLDLNTKITDGMNLEVWRNGIQTITVDEEIAFEVEQVRDMNREVGYREIKEAGASGQRSVVYEIEMLNGEEISRREIQSVVTKQPTKQIEIIGVKVKPGTGLTKAKGVNQFKDSNGVIHRETYYDLPMSRVMQNCGQGGHYTVRDDGVKVDRDGYVIIAANLHLYPRCSVVETSVGLGKVYDTGGFAAVHPHGWDIATDWTNYDGR
ncbi:ubiquitin-like domain-containing protein [Candidatus Saccharibacteria bacterium]|nr:ubiquitin-like domain-containing protein [Candidatus Saccharibacteria bacterium]